MPAKEPMKLKAVLLVAAIVALIAGAITYQALSQNSTGKKILYYTCSMHPSVKSDKPGSCPQCGMALEPVYGNDDATTNAPSGTTNNAAASDTKATPYPLTTCVVSGEKLGEMGAPIVFVYTNNGENQEVKFCCPMCKPKFLADTDKYMKTIKDAEAKK